MSGAASLPAPGRMNIPTAIPRLNTGPSRFKGRVLTDAHQWTDIPWLDGNVP